MALARSASGPGGLSINTGNANSLFGSSTTGQAPATSSMFGNISLSQTPGTTTSAPQLQGLISAPQASLSSSTLFGATPNTSSTLQTSGSMFGSLAATSKPQGGIFGSLGATSQPQQTQGMFGNMASTQPKQGTSIFGQSMQSGGQGITGSLNNQSQSTPGSTSLFNTQNEPKTYDSLFGSLRPGQTEPSKPLFGSLKPGPTEPPKTYESLFGSLRPDHSVGFGGLKMGQGQTQTVPGVRIDVSQMKGTTRFSDLHEDLQKQIEHIEKIILAQHALCADCEAIMPSHDNQLSSVPTDVDFVSRKLVGVESSLEADAEAVALNGQLVKLDAENAKLGFRTIDNLKLPPQYHQGNWIANLAVNQAQDSGASPDLVSFFSQTADEMTATIHKYQDHISEIEQHLRSVEAAAMGQAQQLKGNGYGDDIGQKQREVSAVLREFEGAIRRIALEVADSREAVQNLLLGLSVNHTDKRTPGGTKRSGIY